jgi:hypothetical protein
MDDAEIRTQNEGFFEIQKGIGAGGKRSEVPQPPVSSTYL